jgi:hypothetical protein
MLIELTIIEKESESQDQLFEDLQNLFKDYDKPIRISWRKLENNKYGPRMVSDNKAWLKLAGE